jgi:transcriptional regulator with XRE-family HTH domain
MVSASNQTRLVVDVGRVVRRRRQVRKLTLNELSTSAHISVGMLSKVERGLVSPSLSTLRALCAALGFSLFELMDAVEKAQHTPVAADPTMRQPVRPPARHR